VGNDVKNTLLSWPCMMNPHCDSLGLHEGASLLDLHDDDLHNVACAARRNGDLPAVASTCRRLCRVARSRIPATLQVQGTQPYRTLRGLTAGSDLFFSACNSLLAAAEEGPSCYLLQGVLGQAAALGNLTALELSVLMPPDEQRGAGQQEGSSDGEGVLVPVSHMQQLRQLKITTVTMSNTCATLLAQLTGLTSLCIMEIEEKSWVYPGVPLGDLSPLSCLGHLVELTVHWRVAAEPPATDDGPYALPTSLRRLELGGNVANWLQHLPGCPQLEQLRLRYWNGQKQSAHPAAVLEAVADYTPGLRHLTCSDDSSVDSGERRFDRFTYYTLQLLPEDAVAELTSLQHLDVGCYLRVRDEEHWEALGALTALTTLQGILIEGAPPPGWRHRGVQQLGAVVRLPDPELWAVAAAVLLALPAARVAELRAASGGGAVPHQQPPLLGGGGLEELLVDWSPAPPTPAPEPPSAAAAAPPAAAAGPCALPTSLRRLQLEDEEAAGWLPHLPGCPHLEQLQYKYKEGMASHPAAVLELVAGRTPGLRSFSCRGAVELGEYGVEEAEQEEPLPGMVLAPLTALQHLDAGCYLAVRSAADWQALGHLSALTSLQGIVVRQQPPQAWRHQRVKQLAVVLFNIGGESAAQVLLAFPAVQQARLCVSTDLSQLAPAAAQGVSEQQGAPRVLSSLTSLRLEYLKTQPGLPAAVHAAPILAAAGGVVELSLAAYVEMQQYQLPLPDLSGCTTITRLTFGCSSVADVWDVMDMVQPLAPTLRVLELVDCTCISARDLRVMQQALPRLRHVLFKQCGRVVRVGSGERLVLARLRQQLRLGLTFSVD
jgi:hypothetical protein